MANVVKEIFDRIPHADGGLRRRLTSGILLLTILLAGIFSSANAINDGLTTFFKSIDMSWKDVSGAGVIVIVFAIVFTIGYLIEIIGTVVVRRVFDLAFGRFFYRNVLKVFSQVRKDSQDRGISNQKSPSSSLGVTETEAKTYELLPDYVQLGLTNPYDRRFDVAYRYLISIAPDEEKNWLIRLDANNQNLFSIICAMLLSLIILLIMFFGQIKSLSILFLYDFVLICMVAVVVITVLSAIYSILLRVTIANALDMLTLRGVAQIDLRQEQEFEKGVAGGYTVEEQSRKDRDYSPQGRSEAGFPDEASA